MFINRLSRFRFSQVVRQDDDTLLLTDREPFRFQDLRDNIRHKAQQGDTWWTLAARFYKAEGIIDRPERLWWVIADFQPQPVVDPTLRIENGKIVFVPSLETVFKLILNEDRRVLFK